VDRENFIFLLVGGGTFLTYIWDLPNSDVFFGGGGGGNVAVPVCRIQEVVEWQFNEKNHFLGSTNLKIFYQNYSKFNKKLIFYKLHNFW